MPNLLEKIEANARQRLTLPAGRHPSKDLTRYKNFLKVERHRLQMRHRAGGGGRAICRAQSAVYDCLLRYLLESVQSQLPNTKGAPPSLALVAIGGYGRGELNPQSDIDIMLLHGGEMVFNGKANAYMKELADGLLYTLWDIGLKVGHSVRSIEDCVRIANSDMQSKTSLIEARLVTGDQALFDRMQVVLLAKCVRGFEARYVQARVEDQETRRAKFGNTPFLQEPNIKNGCGGLRDYQNLVWMIYFKYRVRSLRELREQDELREEEFMTETEQRQLDQAYDFLLRTRNELHYQANRAVDVLTRNLQPSVAHHLGYTDRSPRRRLEHFMKDLYRHMRSIFHITRTVEQRLALLPKPSRLPSLRQFFWKKRQQTSEENVDGFQIVEGEIRLASPRVFRDQPRRLMRLFLLAQQLGLRLHPELTQAIRGQLNLVNRAFLADSHVHQTFLEILNQRGSVASTLRLMHEADFLGKYLPEFGKLTCLVQHEFYHQYTADEHTLVCLEKLDELLEAKEPPFTNYTTIFQRLERPFLLYLALLLHDAGKAEETESHAESGSRSALKVAKRLGLDGATTHSLCLIIEHHLTMAQISQRRDLDDPSVIRNFARLIQTVENLNLLTVHTFVDSQGTSPQLWNGFKDSLLMTLYHKTMQVLTGAADFLRAEEKQRELLTDEVRRFMPTSFGEDELQAHAEHLPRRYFQIHSARQVLGDLTLAHRFMRLQIDEHDRGESALAPIIQWHNEPDRGFTSVHVCTWDRAGLFTKIAGCLTAAGLNILSAQIFSRTDGIILDTFFVTDAKTGLLAKREEKERFEKHLLDALTGPLDLSALISRRKVAAPAYQPAGHDRITTAIQFDNESSDYYTTIEIVTEDRVGLLYVISKALLQLGLEIFAAKICTEKGAAIDSFYVAQANEKIHSPERQQQIADEILSAVDGLDQSPASS